MERSEQYSKIEKDKSEKALGEVEESILLLKHNGLPDSVIIKGLKIHHQEKRGFLNWKLSKFFKTFGITGLLMKMDSLLKKALMPS